ncbi:MAG TPA: TIGR03435 family protein [Acidobacteriaceae bacterium]
MKRAILNIVLLVLSVTSLPAQTIAGTWQGILSPPNGSTLRLVCAIEKNPDGSLHGSLNNIDGGGSLLLSSVTFAAPDVTFAASAAALTFRGKLVDDGQSIAGSFTQGNQSLPLTLRLATPETLWRPQGAGLPPMAANADPTFEVATIKPCEQQAEHNVSVNLTGRPFTAKSASAKELIKIAWDLRGRQVLGGPSWFEDIKYDVTGQPDTPGRPSPEQARSMVRKLLVERFHLVSHTAEQSYPIMALTLDPKGPPPTHSDPSHNLNGNVVSHMDGGDVIYQVSGTTMQQFLGLVMNLFQDKQLVDETGLTGAYDITLRIPASAFDTPFDRSLNDERGTAIINAVQQAGFKFVSKKGSLPVVIVDSIDPPTPN